MSAIQVRNVARMYRVYPTPAARLKEILTLNRRSYHQEFWALDGISFDVKRGEVLGIIGPNGLRQKHLAGDCYRHARTHPRAGYLLEAGSQPCSPSEPGFNPGVHGAGECLSQRRDHGALPAGDSKEFLPD